ncbi:MAG: acyltransferase, partial [Mobilicoccus sp.]|nr:acyltransferase [Mobilicoccus sp.]
PATIAATLDPRDNGLNLLRLIMASGVIVYHSFRLAGVPIPGAPLEQGLVNIWVDGFFVLSGFLIAASWIRRPHVGVYLRNRLLRIYPGFVVCLIVTAFVLAPIGTLFSGEHLAVTDQARYVLVNLGLLIREYNIGDTPATVPWPGAWNGSLWTLFWEFLCYLGVLVVGLMGILRTRWGTPLLFVAAWALQLAATYTPLGDARIPVFMYRFGSLGVDDAARFAITFTAGMLIYHWRARLVCSWTWVACALAGVIASMWLPEYRLVGALLLAYALIAAGALMRRRWMILRTDISYGVYVYAFPVQQILAAAGLHHLGLPLYAVTAFAITCVLAWLSWTLIESPALKLKAR